MVHEHYKYVSISVCVILLSIFNSSCEKFLDVGNPPDKVSADFVYQYNTSAAGVLTGIYYDLQNNENGLAQGRSGLGFSLGIRADEFAIASFSHFSDAYSNNTYPNYWNSLYSFVHRTNAAIEGLEKSTTLNRIIKEHLLGEAKFMRAFFYFYLVNLYGNVPLLITTNYKINASASRASEDEVYKQIILDLTDASNLLTSDYIAADALSPSFERLRPNKWAAFALLARVYLYKKEWSNAIAFSEKVISQKSMFDLIDLNSVFLKNSTEAIWQLQPISSDGVYLQTQDAKLYYLVNKKPNEGDQPVCISHFLLSAFESDDQRRGNWLDTVSSNGIEYSFPYKYKVYKREDWPTEYVMVLRLAEQYLIRSEARAELGDIAGAQSDLNVIRSRAGLSDTKASSKVAILHALLKERQVEFFTEWGHRWFDLKRSGEMDIIMDTVVPKKGGVWKPYKKLYPIPIRELQFNSNLTQNEGFPSS